MALTRKLLKSLGLSDEQIETVVEGHEETVSALKEQIKAAEKRAEEAEAKIADYDDVAKERDELKAGDWEKKYKAEHRDFEAFKKSADEAAARDAKEAAARAYFESKKITGSNLAIALRGAKAEIEAIEIEDGEIKDASALDALINGDYAGLVGKSGTKGADMANPPMGGGKKATTKEDILKMTDYQKQIAAIKENPDLFK